MTTATLINASATAIPLADESVQCVVTSPPYWGLRDYGTSGQLGLEATPGEYVENMVAVFREVRRVLKPDGVLWLNLGDSYAGSWGAQSRPDGNDLGSTLDGGSMLSARQIEAHPKGQTHTGSLKNTPGLKNKDLVGIPWRVALALQAGVFECTACGVESIATARLDDGRLVCLTCGVAQVAAPFDCWYLRSDVIWHKPNPMPESVTDRPTKAHEYVFLLTRSERYYYDADAIREPFVDPPERMMDRASNAYNDSVAGGRFSSGARSVEHLSGRNSRSVWTIPTQSYKGAHFATFPEGLVRRPILAGSRPAGKRCDCDEVIASPLGDGGGTDPTRLTGRAGMNRERGPGEGVRPITRREQRSYAEQIKASPHREEMAATAAGGFSHYIQTVRSGARPPPQHLIDEWSAKGWIVQPPPCSHPAEAADIVLDPFSGSGTTGVVALRHGRNYIGLDISDDYQALARERINGTQHRMFA